MENIKGEDYKHMMDWNDGMERGLGICTVLFLGLLVGLVAFEQVNAGGVARVLPSGDGIQMEYQGAEGTQQDVIPLYRAGTVRYFSAGIGLDERGADYPPFALKLVFTAGGKPFLTGVTVTIQGPKGTEKIVIPGERVTGPLVVCRSPSRDLRHLGGPGRSDAGLKIGQGGAREDNGRPPSLVGGPWG